MSIISSMRNGNNIWQQNGEKKPRQSSFDAWYIRLLVAFLCLTGIIQGILRFDHMRRLLNESMRLEGKPLAQTVAGVEVPAYTWIEWPPVNERDLAGEKTAIICLKAVGNVNRDVWILVNGKAVKRLSAQDGVVMCKDGDLVELVSEKGEVNVVVSATSKNVLIPKLGTWVKGKGIILLGRVRLKST